MQLVPTNSATPSNKKKKAKAIRLSEQQKWFIAKYAIENKAVVLGEEGKFTRYRVPIKIITQEINDQKILFDALKINEYHVKDSMSFYNEICELTGNLPVIPHQESVQEDMLKEELAKLIHENETLKAAYSDLYANVEKAKKLLG